MSTMSSHHHPSRAGTGPVMSSSASRLDAHAGTYGRVVRATYKLLVWAIVGFVTLALLNTIFGS